MSQINSMYTTQMVAGTPLSVPGTTEALQGAQAMVPIKTVMDNVLERIYGEFDGLLRQGPALDDVGR